MADQHVAAFMLHNRWQQMAAVRQATGPFNGIHRPFLLLVVFLVPVPGTFVRGNSRPDPEARQDPPLGNKPDNNDPHKDK